MGFGTCMILQSAFPWVDDKRRRKDVEKPWLDHEGFLNLKRS